MKPITEHCPLIIGITVGEVTAMAATLRAPRLQDAYDAARVVPVPGDMKNPQERTAYMLAIDDAELLARVSSLEGIPAVPALEFLIGNIDPEDMRLLKEAAAVLQKKRISSKSDSLQSGSSKSGSSGLESPSS